jgi:hypothetical protein
MLSTCKHLQSVLKNYRDNFRQLWHKACLGKGLRFLQIECHALFEVDVLVNILWQWLQITRSIRLVFILNDYVGIIWEFLANHNRTFIL